jgi:hypothetical protein
MLLEPAFEGHLRAMAGSCRLMEKLLGALRQVKEQVTGGEVVGQAVEGQDVLVGAAAVPGLEARVEDEVGRLGQWLGQWGQQQQAGVWQGMQRAARLCMELQAVWRDCQRLMRAEVQGVRAQEVYASQVCVWRRGGGPGAEAGGVCVARRA